MAPTIRQLVTSLTGSANQIIQIFFVITTSYIGCGSSPTAAPDAPVDASRPPSCPEIPHQQVVHRGDLTKDTTETWRANEGIHVVDSPRNIFGALVIEPCAQVRLGPNVSLSLRETGTLRAGAPDGGMVVFDELEVSRPWGAISTVYGRKMQFTNVVLRNGGNADANWDGVLNFERSQVDGEAPAPDLHVDNVRIENSATHGLDLQGNTGFDDTSRALTITGSKKSAMVIGAKAIATIPEGSYTGNTRNWFELDQQAQIIDRNTVWRDRGISIAVMFGELRIRGRSGVAVLTLEPGVTLQMQSAAAGSVSRVVVGDSTTDTVANGGLAVEGSAEKPVTFRGIGRKNDWAGIHFIGAIDPRSHFQRAVIEDTGADDATTGSECIGGLSAPSPADVGSGGLRFVTNNKQVALRSDFFQNSTIRRSGSNGILPDFHNANAVDFCTTNTFEDIDVCNQTPFRNADETCPPSPVVCSCE